MGVSFYVSVGPVAEHSINLNHVEVGSTTQQGFLHITSRLLPPFGALHRTVLNTITSTRKGPSEAGRMVSIYNTLHRSICSSAEK